MYYRRKIILVDAIQVGHAELTAGGFDGTIFKGPVPQWLKNAIDVGKVRRNRSWGVDYACWDVHSTDYYGTKIINTARPDDWLICEEVDGHGQIISVCIADLFSKMYETNGLPDTVTKALT